jgi:uncharacterized protein
MFPRRSANDKALALAAMLALAASPAQAALDRTLQCRLGSYALSDGRSLAVTGVDGTAHDLAYTLSSGEYGRMIWVSGDAYSLGRGPFYGTAEFSDCAHGAVTFRETGRPDVSGHQVPLKIVDTFFDSAGTRLHGKLVLPADGKAGAIVVWAQGSDDDPATDDEFWQYVLPLHGVGVFVFDKRGSGGSQGELSADFYVRAADTAAAANEARRLAPGITRVGVFGGSQGGWIAPLTATRTDLDFVIVGYGLAEGVTAQDRDEVAEQVRDAGYGDDVLVHVREITDATARIVKSGWKDGYPEFDALRRKYAGAPWLKVIGAVNGYTGVMLNTPTDQIAAMGPKLDQHVSFNYDPRPVIASIAPRQLWVLGAADRTAPSAATVTILTDIQKTKPNLDLAVYRHADHGLVETFQFQGFERRRYPADCFDLIARWILSDALPSTGDDLEIRRGAAP